MAGFVRFVRCIHAVLFKLSFFFVLLREAAKPPSQPTHKVAVHIPSQQDVESDSDIEEVSYPQIYMLLLLFFHDLVFVYTLAGFLTEYSNTCNFVLSPHCSWLQLKPFPQPLHEAKR